MVSAAFPCYTPYTATAAAATAEAVVRTTVTAAFAMAVMVIVQIATARVVAAFVFVASAVELLLLLLLPAKAFAHLQIPIRLFPPLLFCALICYHYFAAASDIFPLCFCQIWSSLVEPVRVQTRSLLRYHVG